MTVRVSDWMGVDRRLLSLADKPVSKPLIDWDDRAETALTLGHPVGETKRGDMSVTERMPLLARYERVYDDREAARLQISYRTIQTSFAKRTHASRRLNLLSEYTRRDEQGRMCVTVGGLVTGYARYKDRVARICLTSPTIFDPYNDQHGIVVDSHLWLDARLLRVNTEYAFPRKQSRPRDVRLGDLLIIDGCLCAYEAQGLRRLGVDEWSPVSSQLLYGIGVGMPRLVHVPRHLPAHMIILTLNHNHPHWSDPWQLDTEIAYWESQFPQSSTGLRLSGR